jgi:hypothetical protein
MAAADALLAQRQPRLLRFTTTAAGANKRKLTITAGSVASIDVYVDNRPVATTATNDGTTQMIIPAAVGDIIRLAGYDPAGNLIAASQQQP